MESRKMSGLIELVRRTALEEGMWSLGDSIVVAVSGGPDSVVLLHVLHQIAIQGDMPLHLIVAHVNHGFRPEESAREALFVQGLAEQLELPFELAELDVPLYMKQTGMGGQEAARELRYDFLHRIAEKYKASAIALAHHGDDQAETVLLRLLRGSGLTGLAGMRPKRREKNVELVRPFLRIYKTDLIEVCEECGYTYVTDSSNLKNKYTRNAIRLDILPFLGQYNGQLAQSLNRLSMVIGDEDDYLRLEADEAFDRVVKTSEGGVLSLETALFSQLHVALQRRLIKLILTYLPIKTEEMDFTKIEAIRQGALSDVSTAWHYDLGGGSYCRREYSELTFLPQREETDLYEYRLDSIPAKVLIPGTGRTLIIEQLDADSVSTRKANSKDEAMFDADELKFPLIVRSREPGDRMRVMGLKGSKKVKDIFIDEKIPPSLRSRIPIIVDETGRILWIPGVRRSDYAKLGDRTSSILIMRWIESDEQAARLSAESGFHSIT